MKVWRQKPNLNSMHVLNQKGFVSFFLFKKKTLIISALIFFLSVSAFLAIRKALASSQDPAISFEVADYGLRLFVGKFQDSPKSAKIGSLGACSRGVFSENYFFSGKYNISFFDSKSGQLSCSDKLSQVAFIRSTSFYHGLSSVVQRWVSEGTDDNDKSSINPLDPNTKVTLLSAHNDDEVIWFEPWLKIADTIATPVMYAITPYQEQQIGQKYLDTVSWVEPQGKIDDENLAFYRANDRGYRKAVLTDAFISSVVEKIVEDSGTEVIVTHSPWGEYGHEQNRQLFCVAQGVAIKNGIDMYVWNGMPDETNQAGGMPVTYQTLLRDGGATELPFVSLSFDRNHYNSVRDIFRAAELNYPKYHNNQPCDTENGSGLCHFWTWDRTWNGYGLYNPPTTAKYYKMVDRGNPIYDVNQEEKLIHMRPYYPDESVFGRRDCLTH